MVHVDYVDFFAGRIKLRHMAVALAIAEHGTTIGAAEALFVSQPAVTRSLHDLEGILGVKLFDRTARGMSPTAFAGPFLDHARAAISHVRQGAKHVEELASGETGVATLGLHLVGTNILLPRAILAVQQDRPAVRVVVREGTPNRLLSELSGGIVDVVLSRLNAFNAETRTGVERLEVEKLYDEQIVVVASRGHPATKLIKPELTDLVSYPWVLPLQETALREELESAFLRTEDGLPRQVVECTSIATVETLVLEGGFLAAVPRTLALDRSHLVLLDVVGFAVSSAIGMIRAADHTPSPVSGILQRRLREVAALIS